MQCAGDPEAQGRGRHLGIVNESPIRETLSATESVKAMQTLFIILVVIMGILALIVGVVFAARLVKPIRRIVLGLKDGADQVATASNEVSSSSLRPWDFFWIWSRILLYDHACRVAMRRIAIYLRSRSSIQTTDRKDSCQGDEEIDIFFLTRMQECDSYSIELCSIERNPKSSREAERT